MVIGLDAKQVTVGGLSFSYSTVEETLLLNRIIKGFARRDAMYGIGASILRRLDICTEEDLEKLDGFRRSTRFPLVDGPEYNNPEELQASLVFEQDKKYADAIQKLDGAATQAYFVVRDKPMRKFVGLWLSEVRHASLPRIKDYVRDEDARGDILLEFGKIVLDMYYPNLLGIQVER